MKKITKKFTTGESRYCQKCGAESSELFEVTENLQKKDQLQYCSKCRDANKTKKELTHKSKVVLV